MPVVLGLGSAKDKDFATSIGPWIVTADEVEPQTTVGGRCLSEPWGRHGSQTSPPMQPGDTVSIEVGSLGRLLAPVT
jgi:2-keto-4-pentenoate hydratase/2-oxohepta-3-ene-1,7-dioic acid hydratase in catechol pathway